MQLPIPSCIKSQGSLGVLGFVRSSRFSVLPGSLGAELRKPLSMPRCRTSFLIGHYYHIYNRGNNRQNIFFERNNYLFFLKQFRRYLAEETVSVLAYCLMPNHYHFLICLRQDNLSEKMALLSLSYTKAINRRFNRCGSLFQGPFQAIHVNREEYLLNLSRYIHLNPVKAGLVQKASSSIRRSV